MPQVSLTRWRSHVIAAETQGLSIAAYAKQHGFSKNTLYAARHQMKQPITHPFVAVQTEVTTQATPSMLEISISPHVVLRSQTYPEVTWLASLVHALVLTS